MCVCVLVVPEVESRLNSSQDRLTISRPYWSLKCTDSNWAQSGTSQSRGFFGIKCLTSNWAHQVGL